MSQYYYPGPQASLNSHGSFAPSSSHHHHHGGNNHRSRRSTRYSSSQNSHKNMGKQPRGQAQKDAAELAQAVALRRDFEAARSFDLDDDEIFCPWHLLTEDDLQSIHSASSDRSSSSGSDSPDNSPLQHQLQPNSLFHASMNGQVSTAGFQSNSVNTAPLKIHQPLAQRARNPIPIVDPNSRHTSPPNSISPARQAQKSWYPARRW